MIDKELSKELIFDHTTKWYMWKQQSVQENETDKFLWNFEMQTDHQSRPEDQKQRTKKIVVL